MPGAVPTVPGVRRPVALRCLCNIRVQSAERVRSDGSVMRFRANIGSKFDPSFRMGPSMRASALKVFAMAAFAALAAVSSASAADMVVPAYTKGPPPLIVVYNWTGFYIGGNAGYSWGRSRTDVNYFNNTTNLLLATGTSSFDMNGWVAGGQLGYNWQNQLWVWGFEGDIQATGQKGSTLFICH